MVTLVFTRTRATIDTLELDASLSETHQTQVDVTEHPVEQGVDITDHKRRKPDVLTIEGLVTNDPTPDTNAAQSTATFTDASGGVLNYNYRSRFDAGRAGGAYQTLLDLADAKQLITVVTALRSYDNMVLTDLSVPRDATSGQALRFTATFREIRVVQNQQVQVSAKTSRAVNKKDMNKKVAPDAGTQQKSRSGLKQLTDSDIAKDPIKAVKALFGH